MRKLREESAQIELRGERAFDSGPPRQSKGEQQ